jgi:predicted P-loop ATPase
VGVPPDARANAALAAAMASFDQPDVGVETGRHQVLLAATQHVAPYILSGHLSEEHARDQIADAMTISGREPNPNEVESALRGAMRISRPYEPPTGGAEFSTDDTPPADPDAWKSMLARTSKGALVANLSNARVALEHAPAWRGIFGYNEFADRLEVVKRPPWMQPAAPFALREVIDVDFVNTATWLQRNDGINVATNIAHDAVIAEAHRNSFHPVRRYFESLVWDGVPRLDTMLIEHLGAEDTPLNRMFGAKTMIAAAARVYQPGCKVKTVLALEGPQDMGKSKFCAALVPNPEWFTDTPIEIGTKDALQQLRGVLIVEQAEMATLSRADANRAKAFISSNSDRYRPSYGRVSRNYPRQCVFVATVNPGANGYLRDETGGSRYWPVQCGVGWALGREVDASAVGSARDQLWAEAVTRLKAGEKWWLDTTDAKAMQADAANARYEEDVWAARVRPYLAENPSGVSTNEVLQYALMKTPADWTKSDQMRVGAIITQARWVRRRVRAEGGAREWRYFPGDGVVSLPTKRPALASIP